MDSIVKTPGCKAFLVAGELAEDPVHTIRIPINIGDDPRKLPCRDCKQVHDYYFSEHELFLTADIKACTAGYSAGSSAAELWNEGDEVPNPIFEEYETPTYQKGWCAPGCAAGMLVFWFMSASGE